MSLCTARRMQFSALLVISFSNHRIPATSPRGGEGDHQTMIDNGFVYNGGARQNRRTHYESTKLEDISLQNAFHS